MRELFLGYNTYEERPVTKIETVTIPQPYSGPGGEPFAVEINTAEGKITVPFATEQEAWDFRDEALDEGHQARVLGAPCRGTAIVPQPDYELDIIDD